MLNIKICKQFTINALLFTRTPHPLLCTSICCISRKWRRVKKVLSLTAHQHQRERLVRLHTFSQTRTADLASNHTIRSPVLFHVAARRR